jgi:hypothetical protein
MNVRGVRHGCDPRHDEIVRVEADINDPKPASIQATVDRRQAFGLRMLATQYGLDLTWFRRA